METETLVALSPVPLRQLRMALSCHQPSPPPPPSHHPPPAITPPPPPAITPCQPSPPASHHHPPAITTPPGHHPPQPSPPPPPPPPVSRLDHWYLSLHPLSLGKPFAFVGFPSALKASPHFLIDLFLDFLLELLCQVPYEALGTSADNAEALGGHKGSHQPSGGGCQGYPP